MNGDQAFAVSAFFVLLGAVCGFLSGYGKGSRDKDKEWEREVVKRHAARWGCDEFGNPELQWCGEWGDEE